MPRKAGREAGRELVETPAETPGEIPVSDQQLETYERIEHIKERYGDDATGRAQIQRRLKDGRLIGLPSIPALTFDTDLVAKRYGGGRYYVRFYQGRQYMGDIEFELDESLQPEPDVVAAPVTTSQSSGDAPTWLAATLDKMGDAIKALAERKAEPPPAPPDAMAMIEKLATTMRALTPPPAPPPPAPPPPTSLKDQIEMIKSVVEVGTSILDARGDGGGNSGDSYMGVVQKLAEPVIELVKAQAGREQLMRGPRRVALPPARATGPMPDQPAASPAPAGGAPQMPWLLEVQRWLPLIQKRSQKGLSAESTAFFVLDELSESTLTALAELAAQDNFEEQVKKLLPAEMQPEWVEEFLVAVKDYLFTEDEEKPDDGVIDLPAEAERRLDALKDKGPDPQPEQGP
jgi:hypothetical protein